MSADSDQINERVAERRVVRRHADMAKLLIDLSARATDRLQDRIDTPDRIGHPVEIECEFTLTVTDQDPDDDVHASEVGE